MAKSKPVLLTVGRELPGGLRELLTSSFQAASTTATTVIAPGVTLAIGQKLRGRVRTSPSGAVEVLELFPFGPSDDDVAAMERYRQALGPLAWPDSRALLQAAWKPPFDGDVQPRRVALEHLFTQLTRFPETWWHDDVQPGVAELVEVLERAGVRGAIDAAALTARGEADLDAASDEDAARLAFCAVLVTAGNAALTAAGDARQLVHFAQPDAGDDDPLYLLCTPADVAAVVTAQLLKPI